VAVPPPLLLEQPLPVSAPAVTSATDVARPNNFFHAMTCLLTLQKEIDDPVRPPMFGRAGFTRCSQRDARKTPAQ
jgi:hypothetical protein